MCITVAKLKDQVVEIVRVAERVEFSPEPGWILICKEVGRKQSIALDWVPASTRFEWVTTFCSFG